MRKVSLALLFTGLAVVLVACGGRNAPNKSDGGQQDGPVVDGPKVNDGPIVTPDGPIIPPDGPLLPDFGDTPDIFVGDGDPTPPDTGSGDGALKPDVIVQPDLGQVDNATCAKAAFVPLVNGAAQVAGTTQGAPNEYGTAINCGSLTTTYNGAQRYYKFSLTAGKSYRFTFADNYSSERMYIFNACGIAAINAACGSGGKTGATTVGTENDLVFTPTTSGDYIVALDSTSTAGNASGPFTLTVQEFTPPTNTSCQTAQQLTLTAGKVSVTGTTATSQNEFGTQVNCGFGNTVLSAPQVYYKVAMTAGTGYRITMTSRYFNGRFYVFGASCNPTDINNDCGSSGAGGLISADIDTNQTRTSIFTPTISATYTIAVDGTSPTQAGDFDLSIEEFATPKNTTCATAQTITLTGGTATVKGTTLGAQNEFGTQIRCNQPPQVNMAGPQVYYKVALTAGKSYKLTYSPQYPGRWYLFGAVCQPAQINTDCAASGIGGDLVNTGDTMTRTYSPTVSGTYTIAIDSRNTNNFGDFELKVEEFTPPKNGTCAQAQTLTLQGGKASVKGDTTGIANQFGNQIRCSQQFGLEGGQVYYKVALKAAETYRVSLTPQFPSRWYFFGTTCTAQQINTDCAQYGPGGNLVNAGDTGSAFFKPAADGTYTIAVDARTASWFGTFDLAIETFTPPTNGTCATAQAVTVLPAGQTTTITGDTNGVSNEFGNAINCGQFGGAFDGPQLYYKVDLKAARTYTIRLNPSFGGGRVYVARNTCTGTAIDGDCDPQSPNGAVAASFFNQPATTTFKPPADGTYLLVVDSTGAAGAFTVEIL
jgi:hypothetical protein